MPTMNMIQQAVNQAAAEYPVKRIELFGSYADGTADEESDVDFLVEWLCEIFSVNTGLLR